MMTNLESLQRRNAVFFVTLCVCVSVSAIVSFCVSCAGGPSKKDGNDVPEAEMPLESFDFQTVAHMSAELPPSTFKEIWGYVVAGYETALKTNLPISDVVYFGADVNSYGHLEGIPKRSKLNKFQGRIHISITCGSYGLTHFVIEPDSRARATVVKEILAAAQDFDGLNIDMELVPVQDGEIFVQFLAELRAGLNNDKMFTVCVPAYLKSGGKYNYSKISFLADRVFVMAYDEHWSTSAPGPVASMNWCKQVANYALSSIGREKLIMGIPFYGRAWGDTSTSRALINTTTENIKKTHGVNEIKRVNGIPTFTYDVNVKVTVYYEDEYSLATRMAMYRELGVETIGFWRIGQETMGIWPLLSISSHLAKK
jgi:hypothetical protein